MDPRTSSLDSNIIRCINLFREGNSAFMEKISQGVGPSVPWTASSHCEFLGGQLIGKKNRLCGSGQPPFNNNYLSFLNCKVIIRFSGIIWLSHDHGDGTGFWLRNIKQKLSFKMLKLKAWHWTWIARWLDIRRELMDLRRSPRHSPPRVL